MTNDYAPPATTTTPLNRIRNYLNARDNFLNTIDQPGHHRYVPNAPRPGIDTISGHTLLANDLRTLVTTLDNLTHLIPHMRRNLLADLWNAASTHLEPIYDTCATTTDLTSHETDT